MNIFKLWRKEAGLSRDALASAVGVPPHVLRYFETGRNMSTITVALKICETLQKDIKEVGRPVVVELIRPSGEQPWQRTVSDRIHLEGHAVVIEANDVAGVEQKEKLPWED